MTKEFIESANKLLYNIEKTRLVIKGCDEILCMLKGEFVKYGVDLYFFKRNATPYKAMQGYDSKDFGRAYLDGYIPNEYYREMIEKVKKDTESHLAELEAAFENMHEEEN